jgi:ABC-type nickel/cobalt efflux system permease component RcnA
MHPMIQHAYSVVLRPLELRTLVLLALAASLLSLDPAAAKALGFGLGLVVAALGFLHWYRRTHMPYYRRSEMMEVAKKDPVASALVIIAMTFFDAVVLIFLLLVVIKP